MIIYMGMDKSNWNGLVKILYIEQIRDNKTIWRKENINNLLHTEGEEFILKVTFSSEISVPTNYYLGLDDRTTVAVGDTLSDLTGEPTVGGYSRQTVDSSTGFIFEVVNGINRAKTPVLTFTAAGSDWGPVSNLFLTTQAQSETPSSGYLISTIPLGEDVTVVDGDSINVRYALSLKDCP